MLVGAPFYYKGVYHMMWQSHTQYIHVPAWNKMPSGQFGDTGISFGHAVSTDLSVQATILQLLVICRSSLTDCLYYSAHWTQLENSLWPDEWCTFLTFRSHFLSQFSLIFSLISRIPLSHFSQVYERLCLRRLRNRHQRRGASFATFDRNFPLIFRPLSTMKCYKWSRSARSSSLPGS